MKNKIKYILAGCCLMTTFSCSDFLERYRVAIQGIV